MQSLVAKVAQTVIWLKTALPWQSTSDTASERLARKILYENSIARELLDQHNGDDAKPQKRFQICWLERLGDLVNVVSVALLEKSPSELGEIAACSRGERYLFGTAGQDPFPQTPDTASARSRIVPKGYLPIEKTLWKKWDGITKLRNLALQAVLADMRMIAEKNTQGRE